jgi:hypothetical protein
VFGCQNMRTHLWIGNALKLPSPLPPCRLPLQFAVVALSYLSVTHPVSASMSIVPPALVVTAGVRVMRLALYGLIVVTMTACGGSTDSTGPGASKPTPNFVRLQSDPGDFIGGGKILEYSQLDAILSVSATANAVSITVQGDQSWAGTFTVPAGASLQAGSYTGATRYPFNSQTTPGLSWTGEGRGCNALTGSFTVDSLTYTGGLLASIDLRFEQHCEGGVSALRGTIHWRADDPTVPAGPVNPVPANLWKPDPAFVPSSGTYVLLASDPGDYIGQGRFTVYTPPTSPVIVSSNGTSITVSVGGYTGNFVAMLGTIPLTTGYYGTLERYPFHNPVRGGLDWSGNGRGCNTLTGWFAIDRIVYTGTTMTALDMRFEQHCDGTTPALRGAIRWSA